MRGLCLRCLKHSVFVFLISLFSSPFSMGALFSDGDITLGARHRLARDAPGPRGRAFYHEPTAQQPNDCH